jgi:hypothetical protein
LAVVQLTVRRGIEELARSLGNPARTARRYHVECDSILDESVGKTDEPESTK